MCTRKCMSCYDISGHNTSPRDDHLKNAHKMESHMDHGRKAALSTHQVHFQKQEAQATKHDMTPNRYHQLKSTLFVIQTCQAFSVVEKSTFRDLMNKDWIPWKDESIHSTVGEGHW